MPERESIRLDSFYYVSVSRWAVVYMCPCQE